MTQVTSKTTNLSSKSYHLEAIVAMNRELRNILFQCQTVENFKFFSRPTSYIVKNCFDNEFYYYYIPVNFEDIHSQLEVFEGQSMT